MTIMRKSIVPVALLICAASLALSAEPAKVTAKSDAEILAIVMAIDEHEIHAAATAEEKRVGGPVLGYAQTLHQDHKKNLDETRDLSTKIGIKPKDTPAVLQMRAKGKEELAKLLPLTGEAFERGFVAAMREGHRDALHMLDEFLAKAQNEQLKQHLTATRQSVAMHLQTAENLRPS
jgi:putative membrane protein